MTEQKTEPKPAAGGPLPNPAGATGAPPADSAASYAGKSTAVTPPPAPASAVIPAPQAQLEFAEQGGVKIENIDQLWRLASAVAREGMAPKGLDTPGKIVIAMEYGMELGFRPMRALSVITVVNGRAGIMGEAALALLRSKGLLKRDEPIIAYEGSGDARTCIAAVPSQGAVQRTFSVADAKRAKLIERNSSWVGYPDRMLQWRAIGFLARDYFSDVLLGLPLFEELRDYPPLLHGGGPVASEGVEAVEDPLLASATEATEVAEAEVIP